MIYFYILVYTVCMHVKINNKSSTNYLKSITDIKGLLHLKPLHLIKLIIVFLEYF